MKLLDYLPPMLWEIKEYRVVAAALEPELDAAQKAMEAARGDFFMASLSEEGVARWEAVFGIAKDEKNLQERRERLVARYLGRLPYTLRTLQEYLQSVGTGSGLRVDYAGYTARLDTTPAANARRLELADAVRQMCPANLWMVLGMEAPTALKAGAVVGHVYSQVKAERGN